MHKTFKLQSIITVLFILLSYIGFTQQYSGISKTHKITSKFFEEEREIRVFVPFSYTENTSEKYPAIYLFDGQFDALFDMTSGTMDFLAQMGELNEYIIIGIKTELRSREFTPMYTNDTTKTDWGDNEVGRADLLEDFLEQEVFPLVKENYRVQPFRLGIGHSLGGTFVLNALLSKPDMFQGVIAISPNLSYDYEQIVNRYDRYLKENDSFNKFIFISAGTVGNMENRFRESSEKLNAIMNYHQPKATDYHFKIYPNANHSTTPALTMSEALIELSKIWTISEAKKEQFLADENIDFVDHIKIFYSNLSKKVNFDATPSATQINSLGYDALNRNHPEAAIQIFDWAIELYPNDANLYDSMAEALEKSNNIDGAKTYYKKASEVLMRNKDQYDPESYDYYKNIFETHLKALD